MKFLYLALLLIPHCVMAQMVVRLQTKKKTYEFSVTSPETLESVELLYMKHKTFYTGAVIFADSTTKTYPLRLKSNAKQWKAVYIYKNGQRVTAGARAYAPTSNFVVSKR